MPENWKTYKLGEVAALRKKAIRPKDFNGEKYLGLEHIGQGDFLLNGIGVASDVTSNKFKFKSGDILYGKIRPYFKKVYKPQFSGICSTDILIIKSTSEEVVTQEYLYQLIKTQAFTDKAVETSSGTKMPRADWNSLEQVEFTFPPLQEQKSIASILSALDDKIELNLQMNKTLEEMAMALYKHWFVDFGPFQDGEFVDSELGEIPKGWEVKNLDEFVEVKNGYAFKGKDFQEEGIPVLKIKNVKAGKILLQNLAYVSEEIAKKASRAKIEYQDILITMTGNRQGGNPDTWVGKAALFLRKGEYYLNQRVSILKVKPESLISKFYLSTMLATDDFQYYFISNSTSSGGQANISPALIYDTPILVPPKEEMDKFHQIVANLVSQISLNEVENDSLTQLRDTLLPKLISGEVRVKDAEKTLTEVL